MSNDKACAYCGDSKAMTQLICKTTKTYSRRYRVCFKCQPSMDSGDYTENSRNHVLGDDDGDLKYFALDESGHTDEESNDEDVNLDEIEELDIA